MALAIFGNQYFDYQRPWKTAKTDKLRTGTTVNISLQLVKALGILLEPFLPDASEKIWHLLNIEEVKRWEFIPLEAGHKVRKAEILFRKVSDEDIIAYVLSYIGKGNPESARILLDKYYKMEDVIKIAKERLGDESEIILRRIYGEKVKITPKREKKEGSLNLGQR